MVISFEEFERKKIESTGRMVIEYKRDMYNREKIKLAAKWFVNEFTKTVSKITDKCLDLLDDIRYIVNVFADDFNLQTSSRYKIVKLISKCTTRLNVYQVWKLTRYIRLVRYKC